MQGRRQNPTTYALREIVQTKCTELQKNKEREITVLGLRKGKIMNKDFMEK